MGRPSEEFWQLSYREIFACIEQHRKQDERESERFGLVAATIMNARRTKPDQKIWEPGDFFRTGDPEPKYRSALEISTELRIAHANFCRTHGQAIN